jgi:RING finger protein 121/175
MLPCTQAASMAFGRKLSVNPNVCALCNKVLEDMSHVGGEPPAEETIQLPCKHLFHALCLRGWTMVGKKDTCPTCLEKTDLKVLYSERPWEARNLQYNGMLDFVRYMVVWFPIIMTGMYVLLHVMHLDTNGQRAGAAGAALHNASSVTSSMLSPPSPPPV